MANLTVEVWSSEKSWIHLPSAAYMTSKVYDCILSLLGCKAVNDRQGRDPHRLILHDSSLHDLAVDLFDHPVLLMYENLRVEVTSSVSLFGACCILIEIDAA